MKSRFAVAVVIAFALVAVLIPASREVLADDPGGWTKSWDGGGDGTNWESAANWNGDSLPGPADKVYIGSGYSVTITAAQSVTWLHSDSPVGISTGSLRCPKPLLSMALSLASLVH